MFSLRLAVFSFFVLSLSCVQAQFHKERFLLRTDSSNKQLVVDTDEDNNNNDVFCNADFKEITLHTDSGLEIPVLHIDRGSDVAIIIGQGLTAPKEKMYRFAKLFDEYDIILFDYRWCNKSTRTIITSFFTFSFVQNVFLDEVEEVRTVASYAKNQDYKKVVGLGICYSGFLFAKAQAEHLEETGKKLFTHLALDSCWSSITSFSESLATDPYLPRTPNGGAPEWLTRLTNSKCVHAIVLSLVRKCFTEADTSEYLNRLECPVLFIHGQNDTMVPLKEFERLWEEVPVKKRIALLTPYFHDRNVGKPSFYRRVVTEFVAHDLQEDFIKALLSKKT